MQTENVNVEPSIYNTWIHSVMCLLFFFSLYATDYKFFFFCFIIVSSFIGVLFWCLHCIAPAYVHTSDISRSSSIRCWKYRLEHLRFNRAMKWYKNSFTSLMNCVTELFIFFFFLTIAHERNLMKLICNHFINFIFILQKQKENYNNVENSKNFAHKICYAIEDWTEGQIINNVAYFKCSLNF